MNPLVRWSISLLVGLTFVVIVWKLARAYDEYEAMRDQNDEDQS